MTDEWTDAARGRRVGGRGQVAEEAATAAGYLAETDEAGTIPPGLQDFYARAEEALRRRNYPYAIAMYRRILVDMPGNLWVRRRLRGTELRRDQEGERPNPVVGVILGLPTLIKILLAGLVGKHTAVLNACESFLARVPTNVWVLRRLARSAEKLDFRETAIFSLENALEVKRDNVKVLVWLSELYLSVRRGAKAEQCMQLASNLRPNDRELAKRANDMSASKTIQDAHLEEGDYTKSLADAEGTEELVRETRAEKTEDDQQRLIRRYTAQVEASPDDTAAVRRLAGAYRANEQWDEAYTWYKRASELDPKDFDLRVMMGEMQRAKYRQVLRQGERAVREHPDDQEAAQRLEQLKREFAEFELEEFKRRVEAYPTNLDLKYELGRRYFDQGEIVEAIRQFQLSVRSPKWSRLSRVLLGRCFMAQDHPELAREQYMQALKAKEVLDDREALEIYYYLAEAQEALGDYQAAVENYGKIYTVDITFRDVVDRMEKARRLAQGAPQTGGADAESP